MLVFGGSLGARTINEAAVQALAGADFRVLHACGARDYDALRARLGSAPPANYDLREFITPFGDALLAADLCVARAGGSIFEIAAHGRPAILVPYPHASADHQSANARWMEQAGAAVVVPDAELTPARLASEVQRAARRSRATGGDGARVGVAGAARGRSADRRGGARRGRGAVSGAVVGARGDRAERERCDHEQRGGEGAPAMGGDGLHHRP